MTAVRPCALLCATVALACASGDRDATNTVRDRAGVQIVADGTRGKLR